jgi:hypothetical protein
MASEHFSQHIDQSLANKRQQGLCGWHRIANDVQSPQVLYSH